MCKKLKFTCEQCGEHRLEEIMVDVVVSSEITVSEDGNIDYGEQSNDGGEVERYQCMACGQDVLDNTSHPLTDCQELAKWIKQRCLEIRTHNVIVIRDGVVYEISSFKDDDEGRGSDYAEQHFFDVCEKYVHDWGAFSRQEKGSCLSDGFIHSGHVTVCLCHA
tara:strand:- start:1063 stop:1551 length:489 start_codon:yes stop_codon:yes gene_type:complete